MPYNGSGTFSRVHNWQEDADNSIDIVPDRHDEEDDGFATGLSSAITKDGQTTITANLPMAGFKHTGVGDATARTQYSSAGQIQDGGLVYVASGGSANAYTLTLSPAVTAYVEGQRFVFKASFLSTGACTLAVNGLTAKNIKIEGLYDPPAYAFKSGQVVEVVYDGTSFQPVNLGAVTGDVIYYSASTRAGYLRLEGTITIGSASSGAANASAVMEGMYRHIWDNYDNAEAAVSTGRGATAVADFAANKTLTLPNFKDRSVYAVGSTLSKAGKTSGAATVVSTGTVGTTGSHTLSIGEIPSISLTIPVGATVSGSDITTVEGAQIGSRYGNVPTSSVGGGGGHTHPGGSYTGDATSVLHPVVGLYGFMKI